MKKKKSSFIQKRNGSAIVRIYTLRGSFLFKKQKYILLDGSSSDYLKLTDSVSSEHYSADLCDFIETWVEDLSYDKLSFLLSQVTDNEVLSASGIQSYVHTQAVKISEDWVSDSHRTIAQIQVQTNIDVLDANSEEIILMMDDVGVKAQKPHKLVERKEGDAKRLDTTVMLVQDTNKCYHYATSGIDSTGKTNYSVKQALIDKVATLHQLDKPLPIVAITDGARSIRLVLQAIFGFSVCIILDWYHLQLKIKNLMSMIAPNKKYKELYINDLKQLLWNGNVAEAIIYIDNFPSVKNQEKCQELRTYLEKHEHEIINYGLRKEAGKTIGSGRCEKANDLIVAHRQKKKGMAWSKIGSSALAIIKTHRLNAKSVAAYAATDLLH